MYYPTGLTSTQFQINVGSNPYTHDYISGGTVTFRGSTFNISNFIYDESTGISTVTTSAYGLGATDIVVLDDILFQCEFGQKTYPSDYTTLAPIFR